MIEQVSPRNLGTWLAAARAHGEPLVLDVREPWEWQTASVRPEGFELEGEEADLIAMYRLLTEEQQEDIFDLVHLKYRKHVERKKESIYWTYHNGSSVTKSGTAEDAEAQGGTA